jgi:uncharacterized membrane protein
MAEWLNDIVYPINRWLHIVCTTLIVGGTLFFELVLPIAIEDLKREQQLYVFARARWVFRWVVWISVAGLLLTGGIGLQRMWQTYQTQAFSIIRWWAATHMLVGATALVIGLLLTIGRRPPEDPVRWMRLNLVILLVAIFLGSATRHFQLTLWERQEAREGAGKVPDGMPPVLETDDGATTRPATREGGK